MAKLISPLKQRIREEMERASKAAHRKTQPKSVVKTLTGRGAKLKLTGQQAITAPMPKSMQPIAKKLITAPEAIPPLKPCRFCKGKKAEVFHTFKSLGAWVQCMSTGCLACGPRATSKRDAGLAWNGEKFTPWTPGWHNGQFD